MLSCTDDGDGMDVYGMEVGYGCVHMYIEHACACMCICYSAICSGKFLQCSSSMRTHRFPPSFLYTPT
ncbi:hypothetical protein EON63_09515 [archaeon]|nr:MAG: hypothetical protein EON63_09515 [archaeon]